MGSLRWHRIVSTGVAGGLVAGIVAAFAIAALAPPRSVTPETDPLGDRSLLDPGSVHSVTGAQITVTDNLERYDRTVRVGPQDNLRQVDPMSVDCHGGRASVVWHIGNLEPTYPDTGIHLTALFDGDPIASILVGSTRGIWNDSPVELRTIVDCPAGRHGLALEITSIHGNWGFPYVVSEDHPPSENLRVNRGFTVTEVWGPPV